jgi:hypothetical protein
MVQCLDYGLDNTGFRVWLSKDFSLLQGVQTSSVAQPVPYSVSTMTSLLKSKGEAYHSCPPSAKAKISAGTPHPQICLHGKCWNNFTFTLFVTCRLPMPYRASADNNSDWNDEFLTLHHLYNSPVVSLNRQKVASEVSDCGCWFFNSNKLFQLRANQCLQNGRCTGPSSWVSTFVTKSTQE